MADAQIEGPALSWIHTQKGPITGTVLRENDTWMWVKLRGDHTLRYRSEANEGRVDGGGEVLCLRRDRMRQVPMKAPPNQPGRKPGARAVSGFEPTRPVDATFHPCDRCRGEGVDGDGEGPDCDGTGEWFE